MEHWFRTIKPIPTSSATLSLKQKQQLRKTSGGSIDGITTSPRSQIADKAPVAIRHAECPICFEELCKEATSVFVSSNGKRVCEHFFS